MTPEQLQQFENLKKQVDELTQWKEARMRQQLTMPLDTASVEALNQAFLSASFNKIEVKSLVLKVGDTANPTIEGEIIYHGTTPSLKTLSGGTVKTFTLV